MATVVYNIKPNPLEGFAQAMGTLANALQQRWQRQATLEDMTILSEVLSGQSLSPEIVAQAMQKMKTPVGAQLLNQVLQKAALEASNIWSAPPGHMIMRGLEPVGQVPTKESLTEKVVPAGGAVWDPVQKKFITPPPTEYQKEYLGIKEREVEEKSKKNILEEMKTKQPKGRAGEVEYWLNKFGLKPTPENVNLVRQVLYADKGKTLEELEQNQDKLAIDLTKAWASSQSDVSNEDLMRKYHQNRMMVRGLIMPPPEDEEGKEGGKKKTTAPAQQPAPAQRVAPPTLLPFRPDPSKLAEGTIVIDEINKRKYVVRNGQLVEVK